MFSTYFWLIMWTTVACAIYLDNFLAEKGNKEERMEYLAFLQKILIASN